MATDLTNITGNVKIEANVTALNISDLTESTAIDSLSWNVNDSVEFENDAYDQMWHDNNALAKETADTLDLQAQVNSFGHTIVFTEISNIIIKNSTTATAIAVYFRLVLDNPQATWVATDIVENDNLISGTDGDTWIGIIHHKIDDSNFVVELTFGVFADIVDAEGVSNTTRSQQEAITSTAAEADPQLKIGVASADPVDLYLSTTEFEFLNPSEYSAHSGTWTIAAGSKNLKIENLGLIPAQYEIIILGSEA